jgi:hypothetical protein
MLKRHDRKKLSRHIDIFSVTYTAFSLGAQLIVFEMRFSKKNSISQYPPF